MAKGKSNGADIIGQLFEKQLNARAASIENGVEKLEQSANRVNMALENAEEHSEKVAKNAEVTANAYKDAAKNSNNIHVEAIESTTKTRKERTKGGINVRKDDILNGNADKEAAEQFIKRNAALKTYFKDESTVLNELKKEWADYNKLIESGADPDTLKSAENRIYKWAKSYEYLGKNVKTISPDLEALVKNSSINDGTKNQFDIKGFQAYAKALDIVSIKTKEVKTEMSGDGIPVQTFGLDEKSINGITESLTNAIRQITEFKSESAGTGSSFGFNEDQFNRISGLFADMESHLKSLKQIFVDVGDGQEFSPLFQVLNDLQNKIDALKDSVSNIKMNVDMGNAITDNKVETKIAEANDRRLAEYRNLLESMRSSRLTNEDIVKFYEPSESSVNELVGTYRNLFTRIENDFKNRRGIDLKERFKDQYHQIELANQQFNRWNNKKVDGISNLFKPDTGQIESVIEGLKSEISTLINDTQKFTSSFKIDENSGLALEKTLQAVKSIAVEIAKYLNQINQSIQSVISGEKTITTNAQQAAKAMEEQAAAADNVEKKKKSSGKKSGKNDVELSLEEQEKQAKRVRELLRENYSAYEATITTKDNGSIIVQFEKEGAVIADLTAQFENLAQAEELIGKGNIYGASGSLKVSSTDTKNIETFEKLYKDIYVTQTKILKMEQSGKTEDQIKPYRERVEALREEKRQFRELLKASNELTDAEVRRLEATARYNVKDSKQHADFKSAQNPYITTEVADVYKQQFTELYSYFDNLANSSDMFTDASIRKIISKLGELKGMAESLDIEFTEEGIDFTKVQNSKIRSLDNLIIKMRNLRDGNFISVKDLKYSKEGQALGELDLSSYQIGTENYYKELQNIFQAQTNINTSTVQWIKSNGTLIGTFKDTDGQIKKVSLSVKDLDGTVRMTTADIASMGTLRKFLDPLIKKFKQLSVYFSTFAIVMRIINSVKEGITAIKELNTALTEFQVVTKASDSYLKEFTQDAQAAAKAVASTTSELVASATNWSRLGMLYCPLV